MAAKILDLIIDSLITALKDPHVGVQMKAVAALAKIKDYRSTYPLIAMLKNENSGLRMTVVETLGEIGQVIDSKIEIAEEEIDYSTNIQMKVVREGNND